MNQHILSLQDVAAARSFYARGLWQNDTMYDLLARWAAKRPEAAALQDGAGGVNYRELAAWVDAVAARFAAAGLRPGDRVAVWLPSRMESVVALLACSRMGYVCVPSFHRDHTPNAVLALLERCGAAALVVQPGYGSHAERSDIVADARTLARMKLVVELSPLNEHAGGREPRFAASGSCAEPELASSAHPDRVIYLAFTSGTTGAPKGVMHSDNTLLSNGRAIAADFGFDETTVVYTLSPMSHNMGTVSLVTALACGGELVVHGPLDGGRALERIVETGARYLVGVPTHAIDLLDQLGEDNKLGAVAVFQLAGSPVPTRVAEALLARGINIQNCFGMTENCSFLYTRGSDPVSVITESCGRCCEGMEAAVWDRDAADRPVPDGETGELGVRGASLMLGYFDDQATTEASFNAAGYFMTGDLAQIDPQGNIRIVGRKKDLIIRGGHNIYPAHIEDAAMRHPRVSKAAAFPVADDRLGEKVCLAVTTKDGKGIDPFLLLEHLDARGISIYEMPEYVLHVTAFPMTASGKILKRELIAMVAEGRLTPEPVRWRARTSGAAT